MWRIPLLRGLRVVILRNTIHVFGVLRMRGILAGVLPNRRRLTRRGVYIGGDCLGSLSGREKKSGLKGAAIKTTREDEEDHSAK